jgi:hypothetical protein
MKFTAFCLVIAVAGTTFAAGQEEQGTQAPAPRTFKLDLQPLYLPGFQPASEVHLALWDSPMSRLELAVSREQWALRSPGPAGILVPFQAGSLPFRFDFAPAGQALVLGPWNSKWDQLTWQEKFAAGAQTTFFAVALVQLVRHAH